MSHSASASYPAAIIDLLRPDALNDLGPGTPDEPAREILEKLTPEAALAPHSIRDLHMAQCCLSGLWLLHDFLDQSHTISQGIETSTGGYWHGIMHRREPDYANAKYWFRQVGRHPVFEPLCRAAAVLAAGHKLDTPGRFLGNQSSWDPFAFIDLCEAAPTNPALEPICKQVQRREFDLLFDYCFHEAVGV